MPVDGVMMRKKTTLPPQVPKTRVSTRTKKHIEFSEDLPEVPKRRNSFWDLPNRSCFISMAAKGGPQIEGNTPAESDFLRTLVLCNAFVGQPFQADTNLPA